MLVGVNDAPFIVRTDDRGQYARQSGATVKRANVAR
jgi:hypothetical protein